MIAEIREWFSLLLVPVLIPLYFAIRAGWRQWRRKRKAAQQVARREAHRADTYQEEGGAALDTLEWELQEAHLENESLVERNLSLTLSVAKLADAYTRISGGKAVEQ